MTGGDEVVRLAAQGDGLTQSGRHVPHTVPGDVLEQDGSISAGPHRAVPPCRHFGTCGGCRLQHADEEVLRQFITDRVLLAAAGQGAVPETVLPTHMSPPRTRRRAVLHAQLIGKRALLGYREAASHRIVDMRECHVLHPDLFALVQPLRDFLREHAGRSPIDLSLTVADHDVDCLVKGLVIDSYTGHEDLLALAKAHNLSRLSLDQGWGAETIWEPEPVTISLAGFPVPLPAGAFLQATADGEAALQADVTRFCHAEGLVADLFAGLGTLSLPLAAEGRRVVLVEADRAAHLASRHALTRFGGNSQALHRDLFRAPLNGAELSRFTTVILDPPRAGAKAQVEELASSEVARIVYVSCNPASWARDAAKLIAGGYRLEAVRPIGQFRWSTHVELSSVFTR